MAHPAQTRFCQSVKARFPHFFADVFVLDIGSLDINGNNQYLFERALYLGVDLAPGRNVDIVSKAHELALPDATFDVVISTECLEHDRFYRETLVNACRLLKPGGLLLLTCATEWRAEHGTRRTTPQDAPLLATHGDWHDYYRNLSEADVRAAMDVETLFADHAFTVEAGPHDLYFWGVKRGVLPQRRDRSFQLYAPPLRKTAAPPRPNAVPAVPRSPVRDIVEILTPFDANEAVQRIKLDALVKLKGAELDFRPFGAGGQATAVVLINSPRLLLDKTPGLATTLTERAKTSVVMLFVPDIDDWSLRRLPLFLPFVDLMLVSTPEMRDFLAAVSPVRVEVLRDPIDFCLLHSMEKSPGGEPPRVVWFGYAESYRRSMPPYQACLAALHRRRDIDYHIVTKQERYGPTPIGTIHEYVPERFLSLLETFDIGVLSHVPADHAVSTLWKSENKAALAINRGLAVAASRTPAYERLFTACGLEDFLFSSPSELAAILRRLTSWSERHRFLTQSQDYVLENYAATRMADDWLALYRDACARKFPVRPVP